MHPPPINSARQSSHAIRTTNTHSGIIFFNNRRKDISSSQITPARLTSESSLPTEALSPASEQRNENIHRWPYLRQKMHPEANQAQWWGENERVQKNGKEVKVVLYKPACSHQDRKQSEQQRKNSENNHLITMITRHKNPHQTII